MSIVELGYLGFDVTDLGAWKRFASSIVGFQVADGARPDVVRLRMDYWHQRIVLRQGATDDLAFIGFRVGDADAMEAVAEKLRAAKYPFSVGSAEDEEERAVMGLLKMESPGSIPIEIFWSPQVDSHSPFHPGRPMHGRFRTGVRGLGHIALREPRSSLDFYKLIGLQGGPEYKLKLPNGIIARPIFMHCNERQHTIQFDLGPMAKRVNHVMIEYDNIDDVGLAHDLVSRQKLDVGMHYGKHANDQAFSFYVGTPSKWLMELGCDVRDTPTYAEYSRFDLFGHAIGTPGYGLDGLDVVGN